MRNWWKSSVLQGNDNDYGEHDYMINELPRNCADWSLSKHKWKCDSCGKNSHLRFVAESYFYTLDGYDSMSDAECWKCRLKSRVVAKVGRAKRCIKAAMNAIKMHRKHVVPQWKFKQYYDFTKKVTR